ncbi:MAG: GNAT family N-acetyltransferase [Pseudomonadota bacterium]
MATRGTRSFEGLRIETLRAARLESHLEALARLRISVFRDWPYLYDGDMAYEARYLRAYTKAGALCVAVWDGQEMVGASTGAPMADHAEDFAAALPPAWPVEQVFYCAESVLLSGYRGLGIGHRFFDIREAAARENGFALSVFASVVRPAEHPSRPATYRPLDAFWAKRGYTKISGAVAKFSWKDVGMAAETEKALQLWGRRL